MTISRNFDFMEAPVVEWEAGWSSRAIRLSRSGILSPPTKRKLAVETLATDPESGEARMESTWSGARCFVHSNAPGSPRHR